MKKKASAQLINEYIEKYQLQQYMDTNLAEIAELHTFQRDDYLIHAEEASDYLYFLVSGKVICFTCTGSERDECFAYHQSVTILGEAASLWGKPPLANVKALCDCVCIAVSLRQHRQTLLNDLRFLQHVCYTLACRMNNEGQICALVEPLEMRLAKFILQYSTNDIFAFQLNDCADILNTSYRHLLRVLKKFCSDQILSKTRNGYLIIDRKLLLQSAGESSNAASSGYSPSGHPAKIPSR